MYGKAWAAILYASAIALQAALDDHHLSPLEGVQIAIALVAAAGVYMVPITTRYRWVKTGVAVLLALLQCAATGLLGGWESDSSWWTFAAAAVGAGLVLLAPATTINPSDDGDVSVPLGSDS